MIRAIGQAHAIGHQLTALYGLDHGQSLAVVLPSLLRERVSQKQDKLAQFAERVWHSSREDKARLSKLSPSDVSAKTLVGEAITDILTAAPGNGEAIGGLKVVTQNAWFAARPSGTEDVYKIYAESFLGPDHLKQVQAEAREVVAGALKG
mgnify:CR=1 FL=1